MVLLVAAYLAYRRSRENIEEDQHLDWRQQLARAVQDLKQHTVGRCYPDTTESADEYPEQTPPEQVPQSKGDSRNCTSIKNHRMEAVDGSDQAQEEDGMAQHSMEAQHVPIAADESLLSLDTTTTFREDVRAEWIHAMFGPDFLDTMSFSGRKKSQQGLGLAKVAPYTAYQVDVPPLSTGSGKLGLSLSRLALGLYVRQVQLGSEAWCAGIRVNSVLVSVNGMNLLAEPSKQALERLWQYEGFVYVENEEEQRATKNTSSTTNRSNRVASKPQTSSSNPSPTTAQTAPSSSIQHPLHMTLIHHGHLYSVVFLSNPPYGIDWAPCGNFALVKRSYGAGEEAGVLKGSLCARIYSSSNNGEKSEATVKRIRRDIYELDHSLAATTLRDVVSTRQGMLLTLCIPPSQARSGHFERLQQAAKESNNSANTSTSRIQRPEATVQLEGGVEVRVHPLFYSTPRTPSTVNPPPAVAASAMVSSAAMSLSQLAFRVAAGELFSFPSQGPASRRTRYQYYQSSSQRVYRPCPLLDQPLVQIWTVDASLSFILRYALAGYDEQRTNIPVSTCVSSKSMVLDCLQKQASKQLQQLAQTFRLQLLAVLGRVEASLPLSKVLLDCCSYPDVNIDLAHDMEFIAQALGLTSFQEQLGMLRQQRLQQLSASVAIAPTDTPTPKRAPRQMPVRVERAPESSSIETQSHVTATTAASSSLFSSTEELLPDGTKSRRRRFGFFQKKKRQPQRVQTADSPSTNIKALKTSVLSRNANTKGQFTANPACSKPYLTSKSKEETDRLLVAGTAAKSTPRAPLTPPKDILFANARSFIDELETVCGDIEKSLLKSFSQKIAGWALQPWSANQETELAQVTQVMRERLKQCRTLPLLNPIGGKAKNETLVAIDAAECYILPSAHFPLLLTFDCYNVDEELTFGTNNGAATFGFEQLYRTKVELVELTRSSLSSERYGHTFSVLAAIGGTIMGSGPSIQTSRKFDRHVWDQENVLTFDSRSTWGAPQTLSLRVSESSDQIVNADENGNLEYEREIGYCFVDLLPIWENINFSGGGVTSSSRCQVWSSQSFDRFDGHGDLPQDESEMTTEGLEIQIKVTVQTIPLTSTSTSLRARKRSLLYKHDDDVRQEMFAIEFVRSCDSILKSCGLDLKVLIFGCIPVDKRRGFIEWVNGSVPLSEICQPFAGSILDGSKKDPKTRNAASNGKGKSEEDALSSVAKAGLTKYESLRRMSTNSGSRNKSNAKERFAVNPIQEYLRAFAFDRHSAYMIRKQVMETYVKSCAGYSVITYILGVGDRHLDNLLLHHTGHFFHCDYSFILGNDPKKFLPLRITEDMVNGMGGRESDNYAMFLSLTCAAFLILRRPENVRHLLSLVRLMEGYELPDVEVNQTLENAIICTRERLRLDLTEDQAISFMEKLVEDSCSSRMWIAVDAIHTLGKRF